MNNKIIISLIILITLCICGTAIVLTGLFLASRVSPAASPVVETLSPAGTESNPQPPQPLDTPLPSDPSQSKLDAVSALPADLAREMDEIQRQVSHIRGLKASQPITRALLTEDELQQKVETDFFKDYSAEDAEEDVVILSVLGLLPEDFDLISLYKELYAEQIAGYYDSESKEMYVVQGDDFAGMERMTYAHEYTHTLQDQVYGLETGLKINEEYCENESEYCLAATALIEGDAVFTEEEWLLKHGSEQDQQDIQDFYLSYSSPVYDSAPVYLQKDLLFPYQFGLEFVYSLNDKGGYALVDQAFRNPPKTTEQILHPDKFPAEGAINVSLPNVQSVLPETWVKIDENMLGEWYSYLVMAYGHEKQFALPESTARTAAAGWGGDRYALFVDPSGKEIVFLLESVWDTENDAREYISAMSQYGTERWGSTDHKGKETFQWKSTTDGSVFIGRNGAKTLWVIAPDESTRQTIQSLFPEFSAK